MAQLKPAGKAVLGLIVAGAIIGGAIWFKHQPKTVDSAQVAGKVSIPDAPEASLSGTAATMLPFPEKTESSKAATLTTKFEVMEWQAQNSLNYANGGIKTTSGSLFEKSGISAEIERQDDCSKSVQNLTKWIKDYHDGTTKDGYIVALMASGMPSYLTGVSEAVKPLGLEYQPVIFATIGKSYGEDKIIVSDPAILRNPQLLIGKVIHGVRLDGDMDLLHKFCGDNGLPMNTNEKVYDATAVNFSWANDYLQAVVDYDNNQSEKREVVVNGKTTGKDTTVFYDGCATWTPGDVNAILGNGTVQGRGGVTLISTKKYGSVMPCVLMTCRKFLSDNKDQIVTMLQALGAAGDQIRTFDAAKRFACDLTGVIYNDNQASVKIGGKTYTGGDYWYEMYNGIKLNNDVTLGGSMVFNLADMGKQFGLNGSSDVYKEIYNTFGTLQAKLYPKETVFQITKDKPYAYVPYAKSQANPQYYAVDKQYVEAALANNEDGGKAAEVQYASTILDTVASKSVHINFQTGSAEINPSSYATLNDIYSSALTAGLKLGVYGYTDNTGNPEKNQTLSEQRAESVKQYLLKKGLTEDAIEAKGMGDSQPIADNSTAAGKAKNRRVQIVLGQ